MNILITSAGQRVSLVRFFQKELQSIFPQGSVYTTDLNPDLAPACQISDRYFRVPRVTSEKYVDVLLDVCLSNNVKLVVPTIDTELLVLSEQINLFKSHNISLLVSDQNFIHTCRDKKLTNTFFENNAINVPVQFDKNNLTFPVFVKPCDGSLSKGIFLASSAVDIKPEHLNNPKLMYMEYISSEEYAEFTVDCYYDRNSLLKCVVPRKRIFVRAGEINKGVTKKNSIINEFKQHLHFIKGARGYITIQVFCHKNTEQILGIEINPRFGGGYPLSYLAGANYPSWIIREYLLEENIQMFDSWEENLLMLRYDAEVLVHAYQE